MELTIRPVKISDAEAINEMKRMNGVKEDTLGLSSNRVENVEEMIRNLKGNNHMLVAEIIEDLKCRVVGLISIGIKNNPRIRHIADIEMYVHKNYQNKGIGKKLLDEIIDLADNWLMLVRLEIDVFVDNEKAINLYKKKGFEIEGTKKYAYIKNGKYVDAYIMARYNKNLVK